MFNDFLTVADPQLYPALPADPNAISPPDLSQINYIVISPCTAADPFVNDGSDVVTLVTPAEIDNTNADNTKSRQLLVEGGIAEHEVTEVEGPNQTTLIPVGGRSYELSARVIISNQLVYEYLRSMQSGNIDFRFWYQDLATYLYGPTKTTAEAATEYGGIRPSYVNVQFPHGEGAQDRSYAQLILRWTADADPPRVNSPITVADGCAP